MRTGVQAGLEIRAARQDDASAISELLTELGHPLEPALALTQIARIQALAPTYAIFVAVKDGAVIGLVSAFSTPVLHRALPVGRVSVLVVAQPHAGQGIGSALLRRAEQFLVELGCGRIEVTSASHREAAHAFYRARGYLQQGVKFSREIPGQRPQFFPSPDAALAALPFSEAVRAGDLLFVSGQIGNVPGTLDLVPGGIETESRQALENMRAILERHGFSLDRVVKCTVFLADMREWPAFNEVYRRFFTRGLPARSALGASGLARGARVEIECVASVGPHRPKSRTTASSR